MSFQDLPLNKKILSAIADLGHTVPTPIQIQAIPQVLKGLDLRASAQTGTGKTATFLLPGLHKLAENTKPGRGPRILILVPTRELAAQVAQEAVKYSKYLPQIKTVCIVGGTPYPTQNRQLSKPYDILIATPGRLIDHMERGRIRFDRVEMFILDEADRMLDMGFIEPVEEIARSISTPHQTLLFSATLKGNVLNLSRKLLKDPVEVSIETKQEFIEQRLHAVDNIDHKYKLLDHLLRNQEMTQTIIFTATKHQADQLADKLSQDGHHAAALHGDLNQRQRTRTVAQLRRGDISILVATDVAARGIDIPAISHVINFDLPRSAEDYIHRIGRTGRAGASGIAISFGSHKDIKTVRLIEQMTGQKMALSVIAGMEPKLKAPAPSHRGPKRKFFPRNRRGFRGSSRSF
jgi:superfamily II DNA/RNA helicase